MTIALLAYLGAAALYWAAFAILCAANIRSVRRLADVEVSPRQAWPRVSLIMPACNEVDSLEAAVRSRLEEDYPDLEVILVEDRSTDGTRELADRIAESDPRLRVAHVTELPDGWLGKQNAMRLGIELSTGEWILLSDADVSQEPGTLSRAMTVCLDRGLDHLAVLPELRRSSLLADCAQTWFVRLICAASRVRAIEDPRSKAHVGVGAFNLFRRSAYDASPGMEWLRLELADDMTLGKMLKRAGARSSLMSGRGLLRVAFYDSVAAMARGSERAGFTSLGNFSALRLAFGMTLMLALELAPFVALLPWGVPWLPWLGAALCALSFGVSIGAAAWLRRPLASALLWPVGSLLTALFGLRAGILGAVRGGIYWRGTFYSTAALRPGRRYGA